MDGNAARLLLQTMIDYFEAGNKESDRAAKNIIEWDFQYLPDWQAEITRLREAGEWSGLRAPEAELVAMALRQIRQQLEERSG